MEKPKFVCVKNKGLKLLHGFRFHPTDEELVVEYLKRKVLGLPLPASVISESDICKTDPWDLPGDSGLERYFFSKREAKYPNGNRSNRSTGSGYWKATGIDKRIVKEEKALGMKKTLVFYRGKPPSGIRTNWILHEYRLTDDDDDDDDDASLHNWKASTSRENWVLCRIFVKKRNKEKQDEKVKENERNGDEKVKESERKKNSPVFYDFLKKDIRCDLNMSPSSPTTLSIASSAVTETCSNDSDDHSDEISCLNLNKTVSFL